VKRNLLVTAVAVGFFLIVGVAIVARLAQSLMQ
jgi:hypothetical protein